jgi:hypothetical protein
VLTKCANPICPSPFRRLSEGKLFRVEAEPVPPAMTRSGTPTRRFRSARRVQHYWLCDQCSPMLTLIFERGRGMTTVPLPIAREKMAAIQLRAAPPVATDRVPIAGWRGEQ